MDHRRETALEVLQDQLADVGAAIEGALERLRSAHSELGSLLETDDALRRSIELLSGESREEAWIALSALRPRLREILDEVHMAERASLESRARRTSAPGNPPTPSDPIIWDDFPQRISPRAHNPSGGEQVPNQLDVEAEAVRFAEESDGRVRVRALARYLYRKDRGRYSDERSAYSSVFSQLERSDRFVRGDRGEFVLVRRIGAQPSGGPNAGDLPFE